MGDTHRLALVMPMLSKEIREVFIQSRTYHEFKLRFYYVFKPAYGSHLTEYDVLTEVTATSRITKSME